MGWNEWAGRLVHITIGPPPIHFTSTIMKEIMLFEKEYGSALRTRAPGTDGFGWMDSQSLYLFTSEHERQQLILIDNPLREPLAEA